jgi:hypothetical protein
MLNKLPKTLFHIIILLLFAHSAFGQATAQPDDKTKPGDKSTGAASSFRVSLNYLSNSVFMGRTDSVTTPSIIPGIKYTLKSGIYFSGSLYYLPTKNTKNLDGGGLTAGYDKNITDDLSAGASYSRQFFRASSTQITSSVRNSFDINFDYDAGYFLSPSLSAIYNINKQGVANEFFASLDLSHDFIKKSIFTDKDLLLISPTFTVSAGADYTGAYAVLNYEIAAPCIYKAGHFIFQIAPTYSIPESQLPADVTAVKPSNKSSVFYFMTGVSWKF